MDRCPHSAVQKTRRTVQKPSTDAALECAVAPGRTATALVARVAGNAAAAGCAQGTTAKLVSSIRAGRKTGPGGSAPGATAEIFTTLPVSGTCRTCVWRHAPGVMPVACPAAPGLDRASDGGAALVVACVDLPPKSRGTARFGDTAPATG